MRGSFGCAKLSSRSVIIGMSVYFTHTSNYQCWDYFVKFGLCGWFDFTASDATNYDNVKTSNFKSILDNTRAKVSGKKMKLIES